LKSKKEKRRVFIAIRYTLKQAIIVPISKTAPFTIDY